MKNLLLLFLSITIAYAAPSFLMPDEAFIPKASINDKMQIDAEIEIAKGIYLYDEKLRVELINNTLVRAKSIQKPDPIEYDGEKVHKKTPKFFIELEASSEAKKTEKVTLKLSYQGCSEQGLCYEPLSKEFSFDIDTSKLEISKEPLQNLDSGLKTLDLKPKTQTTPTQTDETQAQELSETDLIADTIKNSNILIILLTFLGFGLLLALTPCVFPMIPIISGVIISQGSDITTRKAFMLSIVYVLSMAVAYTIAGVLAGLFGANLQAALQTPWVIYSFAAVFVILAMSMFGFYELKLPDSLVNKVSTTSKSRGGYIGVAIMGFLSALIVGPCVAAPLAGALVYIGQTGDAILGGMALFSMSIGMGIPLILVGISAGRFMPKPGSWMTMVTASFGVMMLAVAIWMLERVVDEYITMLLYSVLGISYAIYLGALESGQHIFKKSVAVVLFVYSLALLLGVLAGSTSMIKPLEFLRTQASASTIKIPTEKLKFTKIVSISELDNLLEQNKGKKILLDFSAEWCTSCKELEAVTFTDDDVKAKMQEFVLIKADITANSKENQALTKKYGVFGPPALLFFDTNSKLLSSKTVIGFIEPEPFLQRLGEI